MGAIDISGIATVLLNAGPWGAAVLFLLWERNKLTDEIKAVREARTESLERIVVEVTKVAAASTDAMRASTAAHERHTEITRQSIEVLRLVQQQIAGIERDIDRLERERAS